jgi:hypothetical protein
MDALGDRDNHPRLKVGANSTSALKCTTKCRNATNLPVHFQWTYALSPDFQSRGCPELHQLPYRFPFGFTVIQFVFAIANCSNDNFAPVKFAPHKFVPRKFAFNK